jgi:tetratricopeptide (TPR) repeat protein
VALAERGSGSDAMDHLEQAVKLSRQVGNRQAEIAQLIDMGLIHLTDDRLEDARSVFIAADELTTPSSPLPARASIASNLGVILRDLGRFDEALEQLGRALELASQHAQPRPRLLTSWCIGSVLHLQGRHGEAMREYERILEGSVAEHFSYGEALALLGLCATHRAVGDLAGSLRRGREALALSRKYELRKVECETLTNISETLILQNDLVNAGKTCEQSLVRAEEHGFPRYRARTFEALAHVAHARGDLGEAERCWRQALDTYPPNMAEAAFAEVHLRSLGDSSVTCFRCAPPASGEVT